MRYAALAVACCSAVLVAGCSGGSGSGPAANASTPVSLAAQSPSSPAASGSATPGPSGSLATGIQYADPDGSYRIVTGPAWISVAAKGQALQDHTEGWQLGPAEKGFSPYVSISTAPSQGQDLASYLRSAAAGVSKGEDNLLGAEVVPGTSGGSGTSQLARLEFTTAGLAGGPARLHLLILTSIEGANAVSAALVCPDDEYETYRAQNEPYLRTLTAT